MGTTGIISEAEKVGQDLQLEREIAGQVKEAGDKEATQKTKLVTSYIESWVGCFGSSQDRRRGRRELCFTEGLGDVSDQVGFCLSALAVMSETMVSEAWRGGIADGFCIITALISEAVNMTIQALDEERKLAARENKKLREELNRIENKLSV